VFLREGRDVRKHSLLSSRLCHCNGQKAINSLFGRHAPESCFEEWLGIASQLRETLSTVQEYASCVNASIAKGPELKYQPTQMQPMKIK